MSRLGGSRNGVVLRRGAAPVEAPVPAAHPGKVLVHRLHACLPTFLGAAGVELGRMAWVGRLRHRYPRPLTKALAYVRDEGVAQTWAKTRARVALERGSAARGAFSAVGVVVETPAGGPPVGTPTLCWSWQGPLDADFHLVAPEQCLPVPEPAPVYALAPILGWILSVLRRVDGGIAAWRLAGLEPPLATPLAALLGEPARTGRRVVIQSGADLTSKADELAIRLTGDRAVVPLIERTSTGWICRLPDPEHYLLDPYYPGPPESPEPFGRAAVEEAVAALARGAARAVHSTAVIGVARPVPPPGARTIAIRRARRERPGALRVSCLGAGNFVRAVLLHQLRRHTRIALRGVMDVRPEVAALQAQAMGAAFCTTDPAAVIEDPETDLVLVASDHASHADYAIALLRAGKAVHLEKPPAVEWAQLARLIDCVAALERPRLWLGYNRPHAPAAHDLAARLEPVAGPTAVTCVVSGYRLPRAHWYHWPGEGTRIAGNLVHWIELGYRLVDRARPLWVNVATPEPADLAWDALVLSVGFEGGSLLTIAFSSAGDETHGIREVVDVKRARVAAEIDDFRTLRFWRDGHAERLRYSRDKGHAALMAALARNVQRGQDGRALCRDLARTGAIQLAAQAALGECGGRRSVEPLLHQAGH
jgi:predicted dehydrogenase